MLICFPIHCTQICPFSYYYTALKSIHFSYNYTALKSIHFPITTLHSNLSIFLLLHCFKSIHFSYYYTALKINPFFLLLHCTQIYPFSYYYTASNLSIFPIITLHSNQSIFPITTLHTNLFAITTLHTVLSYFPSSGNSDSTLFADILTLTTKLLSIFQFLSISFKTMITTYI